MALQHPLFGVGIGKFYLSFAAILPASYGHHPEVHAHNVFLHLMAGVGVPAFACFIWALRGIFDQIRLTERNQGFRYALLLGAVGGLFHNLVDYGLMVPTISLVFWGLLGTVVGASRKDAEERLAA